MHTKMLLECFLMYISCGDFENQMTRVLVDALSSIGQIQF